MNGHALFCYAVGAADSRRFEKGRFEMDETLKKMVACSVLGGVTLLSVHPMVECEHGQLCEVKSTELPHTHDRSPAPTRTVLIKEVTTTSSAVMLPRLLSWR